MYLDPWSSQAISLGAPYRGSEESSWNPEIVYGH